MSDALSTPTTAFLGGRCLHEGPLAEVALAVKAAVGAGAAEPVLVFDDASGRVIDLDLRGSDADVIARLSRRSAAAGVSGAPTATAARERAAAPGSRRGAAGPTSRRGPGRPKLGVVGREVTLLPRHWAWLAEQPSGASATLRRLVDEARRTRAPAQRRRKAQEVAYRVMHAIAGDAPGYEEATRALFADDRSGLEARTAAWPEDVRRYVLRLAFPTPTGSVPGAQGSTAGSGAHESTDNEQETR